MKDQNKKSNFVKLATSVTFLFLIEKNKDTLFIHPELIQADIGHEAVYTMDKSPVHCGADIEEQITTHTHIHTR